jgi:hypothetical protein
MWKWLNETLQSFKYCFSRPATFSWFVIIVVGLMLRTEHLGLTSIVRELSLSPDSYRSILHFFRSEGWTIDMIRNTWLNILISSHLVYRVAGKYILISDGVMQSKEGRYMPGVKKLHQESENSAKGEFIFGHMFGGLGLLMGDLSRKLYCVLISLRLHDGLGAIHGWDEDASFEEESHVVKTIRDAILAVQRIGPSILLLDRLYLTVPMLQALSKEPLLQVVTRAKMNYTAFYGPKPKTGRGAKAKKGEKAKIASFFQSKAAEFITAKAWMYGKSQEVSYYCIDLLWGDKLYKKLRFVLVIANNRQSILASTDLSLSPLQIMELYGYRFKIECSFRELKQVVAGLSYRFWSKHMPKLSKYKKNEEAQETIKEIEDEKARSNIRSTVEAINGYAMLGCIALGLLQMISLFFADTFSKSSLRFMRTKSNAVPSEATIADFMRKNIYRMFHLFPELPITCIIKKKQIQAQHGLDDNIHPRLDKSA